MSKSERTAPKFGSLKEAGLENFTVVEMQRAELIAAAYNPRKISDQEREKLKVALKRHGLVEPVVWNKQTSNLVGGHQRISIMDSLMGSKEYTLQVSVIDVDPQREKEINVLLNNSQASGSFDLELLKPLFDDEGVTIEGAGFSKNDMIAMFGTGAFDDRQSDLEDFASHLSAISEKYSGVSEANKRKSENEHYLVFVFPDGAHADAVIAAIGGPNNRYQNGAMLLDKLGVTRPETAESSSKG